MNFITWLKLQTKRNDPVGDLARDLANDRDKDLITGYRTLQTYLIYRNASDKAISASVRAYREYQANKRSGKGV